MSKSLNGRDISTNIIVAHKRFNITESTQSDYSIEIQSGSNISWFEGEIQNGDGTYPSLIYNSVNKLYYEVDDFVDVKSYDFISKSLGDNIIVYNIPRELYGLEIQPGTFVYESGSVIISDDEHYNLKNGNELVGNIFYQTGHVVITNSDYLNMFNDYQLRFESTIKITEFSVLCNIDQTEFNYTLNSTAYTSGSYKDEFQNGLLKPHITTIGLYNDNNDLVAVAKFPKPIEKPNDIDISFLVKLDI